MTWQEEAAEYYRRSYSYPIRLKVDGLTIGIMINGQVEWYYNVLNMPIDKFIRAERYLDRLDDSPSLGGQSTDNSPMLGGDRKLKTPD